MNATNNILYIQHPIRYFSIKNPNPNGDPSEDIACSFSENVVYRNRFIRIHAGLIFSLRRSPTTIARDYMLTIESNVIDDSFYAIGLFEMQTLQHSLINPTLGSIGTDKKEILENALLSLLKDPRTFSK